MKWLSDKEDQQARAHKSRHAAKGNGFGYTILSSDKPSPTWPFSPPPIHGSNRKKHKRKNV
jgi:hypothetical protein